MLHCSIWAVWVLTFLSTSTQMNEEVPRACRQRENNTVPQLPCLCILKAPNTSTLSTGWWENQGASLLFPSQQAQWGSALCQATGNGASTHLPTQPPTPCYRALASWALESTSSAPQDDLTPKFSSSSPSPSHSPAMGLQTAHGDTPNIHPEATSNRGGKKEHAQFRKLPQLLIENKI